jgi:hypothetical protein
VALKKRQVALKNREVLPKKSLTWRKRISWFFMQFRGRQNAAKKTTKKNNKKGKKKWEAETAMSVPASHWSNPRSAGCGVA